MPEEPPTQVASFSDTFSLSAGDPFFELAQEMNERIGRRALECSRPGVLPTATTGKTGSRRNPNFLRSVPVEVLETETELTIRADVPASTKRT